MSRTANVVWASSSIGAALAGLLARDGDVLGLASRCRPETQSSPRTASLGATAQPCPA